MQNCLAVPAFGRWGCGVDEANDHVILTSFILSVLIRRRAGLILWLESNCWDLRAAKGFLTIRGFALMEGA